MHGAIEAAGGIRLQVNLADEHVQRAMRISTFEPPIDGFVSVWTASASAAPTSRPPCTTWPTGSPGWEVEERRPIEPPEDWDGSRLDGLSNIAVIRRPAELTQEEWLHRWRVDHTPIAIATQATFGYSQNLVVARLTEETPEVSGIVEELFPMAGMDDMHAFYGSDGDDAELTAAAGPADGERGPDRRRPRSRPGADVALPLRAQARRVLRDDLAVERPR